MQSENICTMAANFPQSAMSQPTGTQSIIVSYVLE